MALSLLIKSPPLLINQRGFAWGENKNCGGPPGRVLTDLQARALRPAKQKSTTANPCAAQLLTGWKSISLWHRGDSERRES